MTYAIRCGLIAIACGLFAAGMAHARDTDANIAHGPSRAELFELRWKSDLGPNAAALAPKLMQPFFIPKDILGDAVYGIALSYHNDENCACKAGEQCRQCRIDWARIADSRIAFVFLKATQGARHKDPTFEYHWRALAQHKLHRGARHFMSADEDPVEQADHFVERIEAVGKLMPSDLSPVLELERDLRRDSAKKWIVVAETGQRLDFWQGQDPDEIVGKILKWLNRVEQKTGRVPIIYTSRSWWMEHIKDEKKFALLRRYPLWIADYPESGRHAHDSPRVPNSQAWTIWQFTENGQMQDAGIIPGNVEVSVFRGTLARFRQAMKVSAAEVEVARAEDSKKTARAARQMAAVNAQQASDASDASAAPPAAKAVQAAASTSQAVVPAQPDHVVAAAGNQPVAAASSKMAAVGAPPEKSNQATQQPPQATSAQSSQTANLANPGPPVVGSTPAQPGQNAPQPQPLPPSKETQSMEATPPAQTQSSQPVPANAGSAGQQAPDSNKLPQTAAQAAQTAAGGIAPQTSANQGQLAPPVKLAQQTPAAGANAAERAKAASEPAKSASSEEKAPPAPQVAAANPSNPKEAASSDQRAAPRATGQKAGADNQKASTASAAPPTRTAQRDAERRAAAERAAEENTPGEKAPTDKSAGERIMVEIELLNGRKLRVDANIDPSVLQRLISAIDK
jgi:lysozyme